MISFGRMTRRIKTWTGIGILVAAPLGVTFYAWSLQPKSLEDFERRCVQAADLRERQRIALDAVNFLVQQQVPDSIANQIRRAALAEKPAVTSANALFLADSAVMNDALWAACEDGLKKFLPAIFYLKRSAPPAVIQTRLAAARKIAESVDAYTNCRYWVPLLNSLSQADSASWYHWRMAVISANKSQEAYKVSEYKIAAWLAIAGLQHLPQAPADRRLNLDLCFRLQNAIAEGESAFRLAFAFGAWITDACIALHYHLRAVAMEYNIANQLLRTGRYDEMIERLNSVQHITQRWRNIPGMDWYRRQSLERLSLAFHQIGEYQVASQYLEEFGNLAKDNTELALYHMNKGQIAEASGNYEIAEQEYSASITAAKGKPKDDSDDDFHNAWEGYHYLGDLFLKYDLPEKALKYYREAEHYANRREDFLNNNERAGYSLIRVAETQIRQNQLEAAKRTLAQAELKLLLVDSPRWQVEHLLRAASLRHSLNEHEEAKKRIAQALDICRAHRLFTDEIKLILQQATFALQAQSDTVKPVYPVEELSRVIGELKSNNDKRQLIQALALLIDAAYKAGRRDLARSQANLLLTQTEALSQQYAREERLIFFQHSIYENIKAAIQLDILLGQPDSAFVKLSYVKGLALRHRMVGGKEKYMNLAETQRALHDSEAVLDYMVTTDTLYAFILTNSALQLVRMPAGKQQLQTSVDAYVGYLKNEGLFALSNAENGLENIFWESVQRSNSLYQAIFAKVAPRLRGIDRLYIVPDEFLYAVPFNALALRTSIDTPFLIEEKAIMVIPGAWMLTLKTDSHAGSDEANMLASIDPNIPGAEDIEKCLRAKTKYRADIQTQWENKSHFKRQLAQKYRCYLFYAHATADWDEPRQSWIGFPLNPPTHLDRLSYSDIDSLDWRQTELVVLAGCETSGKRIYLGAGLAGLQQAFLAAGARQVLAAYWKVDAVQVADQLPHFLEAWEQTHDALQACQFMQKTAIVKLKNDPFFRFPHPQLWGAFNLAGIKPEDVKATSLVKI
jgi:CHAT domain-containing protein